MARKSLEDWVQGVLGDTEKGPCTTIALVHVAPTGEREIHTTSIAKGMNWTAKELANMFRGKAEEHCQDLPGVHTYQLLGFFKDQNEATAFRPFTVKGQPQDYGVTSEPPTPEGRLGQRMRHEEAFTQQLFRERENLLMHHDNLLDKSMKMIETLSRSLHEATKESLDAVAVVKEIMLKEADKSKELALAVEKEKRETGERKTILNLLPPLVNQITGTDVFPQSTEDTALVNAIAENITEEQIQMLAASGILSPLQLGILSKRMEKILREKREEHETALARVNEIEADAPEEATEVIVEKKED